MFDHIDYDPTSSTFFRFNQDVGVKIKAGMEAGSKKKNKGRVEITVDRIGYSGNRVAWEKLYGEEPPEGMYVVPLDGNSLNLEKENLALMTKRQQRIYTSVSKGTGSHNLRYNKDGTVRVYFQDRRRGVGSELEALGTYPDEDMAMEVFRRRQLQMFIKETE